MVIFYLRSKKSLNKSVLFLVTGVSFVGISTISIADLLI
jgi:hypothetical protein